MKSFFMFAISMFLVFSAQSQSELPYHKIPDYPKTFTASTVAARVVDGLGFRYYWATEGLRTEDLNFQPTKESRNSLETIRHIYDMTKILSNTLEGITTEFPIKSEGMSYTQLREGTLTNIKKASDLLKLNEDIMANHNMKFAAGENKVEYPFWNLLNGPMSDALWHVGQVVTLRRSSGNPINPKAEVLLGRLLD